MMQDETLKIVLIEDCVEDRAAMKAALLAGSSRRYSFHEASSAAEGMALLKRLGGEGVRVACVLLDYNLPDGTALDVLASLRAPDGQTPAPVVVVTGGLRDDEGGALIAAGAQDFIGKSWLGPASLTRAVEHSLERHALIVQQRRTEATAREAERKLEGALQQAQKLESLGVLAGGIAHDFNNLLVAMLGHAEITLSELPPASPLRREVEAIRAAATRASALTAQLLGYAGKGRFVIQRVDLGRLLDDAAPEWASTLPPGTRLERSLAKGLPAVEADAVQLRQVVANLIANASEAVGAGGGVISLRTRAVDVRDGSLPPGRYVCLEVTDTGRGMTAETQARIFDPFFTTGFTGRGLGLAAVLGILRAHRGSISVQSELGRGSTFTVLLPALEAAPDAPRAARPTASGWRGSGTILLVDDDEMVRKLTRRVLESAGFTVKIAVDGVEAMEVFRAHQADIRAVLLDLTMPRMSGEETFLALREIDPAVRVLLTSGYAAEESTSRFAGLGVAGFVEKPFRPQVLIERLREVLEPTA